MQIRISAGKYKNKKLKVPQSASPVRERVKLAIFSIIGDKTINADVADLCAGTGNLGLEAISRGAKSCIFVEDDHESVGAIKENIENTLGTQIQLGSETQSNPNGIKLVKDEVTKFIYNEATNYDIIFFDPPYDQKLRHTTKYFHEILKQDGLLIYFHHKKNPFDEAINSNLKLVDSRTYGITTVDFISKI